MGYRDNQALETKAEAVPVELRAEVEERFRKADAYVHDSMTWLRNFYNNHLARQHQGVCQGCYNKIYQEIEYVILNIWE